MNCRPLLLMRTRTCMYGAPGDLRAPAPYHHIILAGVVFAFAEPDNWCAGAVLNVAWCAVYASAAPNSWRIEDVLVVAGVV